VSILFARFWYPPNWRITLFLGLRIRPEYRAKAVQLFQIPLGRLTTADDVANVALRVAVDEASFITGMDHNVDGGRSI
jgi:3-oxoacyl-[acyl-carrier protein] reductase